MWIGGGDNFESSVSEYILYGRADKIIVIHEQNLEARRSGLLTAHWYKTTCVLYSMCNRQFACPAAFDILPVFIEWAAPAGGLLSTALSILAFAQNR